MVPKSFQSRIFKMFLFTLALIQHHEALINCPRQCTCNRSLMECHGFIPMEDTNNIKRLIIKSFNVSNVTPFAPGSFDNLINLEMSDLRGILPNYYFSELKNLKQLKLQTNESDLLSQNVFAKLDKVEILDLSDNVDLIQSHVLRALNNSKGQCLPALKKLYLRYLDSRARNPIDIDAKFEELIATGRKIQHLDLSGTNIGRVYFNALEKVCMTMNTLVVRNCAFASIINNIGARVCENLKTFDIADSNIPSTRQKQFEFYFKTFNCYDYSWFTAVEYLDVSNMLQSIEPLEELDIAFLSKCQFRFKHVIARKNNIKRVNGTYTYELDDPFQQSIIHLDLSSNVIEYYNPIALNVIRNVQTLNLSSNRLHVMQINHPNTFETLFSQCSSLHTLDLSFNMLTNVPPRTFVNNTNLTFINISGNKLTDFNVLIHSLTQLESLDLTGNQIVTLSSDSLSHLDFLNQRMLDTSNITSTSNNYAVYRRFQVNLSFNPFKCDCDDETKRFLEWMIKSDTVLKSNKTKYTCKLENEQVDISVSALERSEVVCWHKELLRVFKFVGPITAVVLIGVLIIVIGIQRHRRKIQNIEKIIREIKENTFPRKFLVFLSYCSEDIEFVHEYIYPPMSRMFAEITECTRDLICFGDRHFHAGSHVHTEVVRCMEESAVAVFVVSNSFCRKGWCQMEVDEAFDQKKQIIMLMREHVDPVNMPKFLKTIFNRYTHASWVQDDNGGHIEPDWKDLCRDCIELAIKQTDYHKHDGIGI